MGTRRPPAQKSLALWLRPADPAAADRPPRASRYHPTPPGGAGGAWFGGDGTSVGAFFKTVRGAPTSTPSTRAVAVPVPWLQATADNDSGWPQPPAATRSVLASSQPRACVGPPGSAIAGWAPWLSITIACS